jgi:hypothetical protein
MEAGNVVNEVVALAVALAVLAEKAHRQLAPETHEPELGHVGWTDPRVKLWKIRGPNVGHKVDALDLAADSAPIEWAGQVADDLLRG